MSEGKKIFRTEVLEAKSQKWAGNVILTRPFSFTFLTICSVAVGLVIIIFITFGGYTKRNTVQGQLVPKDGLVQVYSSSQGLISKQLVTQGQVIKKDDALYSISTARYDNEGSASVAIDKELENKAVALNVEKYQVNKAHELQVQIYLMQKSRLESELNQIVASIKLQEEEIETKRRLYDSYSSIVEIGAVSKEDFDSKKMEYLLAMERKDSLENNKFSLEKQVSEQLYAIEQLKHEHKNQLSQLDRLSYDNEQQSVEVKSGESLVIRASQPGVVSSIYAQTGQYIDPSKPLMTILPQSNVLIAQLYVPDRAIGFMNVGDIVLLRYQAYPYQKFGHAKAKISSIAKTAMAAQNIPSIGTVSLQEQMNNEPMYLVQAILNRQDIKAYGKDLPLQVGMTLEADVLQERRKLYEWVLEPIYSITGKI
ncbi:HlyD family secretion protein [Psychrobacter celer]|uniref:HlyD family secretion protein n=1 Tax=Psychrobacter celer TaxID=306572 RepID=UPI003FD0F112